MVGRDVMVCLLWCLGWIGLEHVGGWGGGGVDFFDELTLASALLGCFLLLRVWSCFAVNA